MKRMFEKSLKSFKKVLDNQSIIYYNEIPPVRAEGMNLEK